MKHLKKFENMNGGLGSEMYVVYVNDERHSAWDEEEDANKQIDTLEDNGYKNCYYEYEPVEEFVEDGHYYV